MTLNVAWPAPIKVGGQDLHNTATFTYLGSLISQTGGTSNDICSRLNKARYTFNNLNVIWSSAQYSKETKLSIYQSCVLPILLYGSESWRMTDNDMIMKKLSSFHTKSLTKSLTLRIFWLRVISNKDLLAQCHQENMRTIIRRRRWSWIGHVLRMEGCPLDTWRKKRQRGRPKTTWRRTVETELKLP